MGRYLRSQKLRELLWIHSKGKCQQCGCQLPKGWHADHINPWSKTNRTNIFEMQALCPTCNLKKGNKMGELFSGQRDEFFFDTEKMRPGQFGAVQVITDRVRNGEKYTAIVLPTRYGKSDVIRVTAIWLWYERQVSSSLVLSPNKTLRDQIVSNKKFPKTLERYGIKIPGIKKAALKGDVLECAINGEVIVSTTMQLLQERIDGFCNWVKQEIRTKGLPPIIFIDECHTGSEENKWGQSVVRLVGDGAFAVLLTATPIRSDGNTIPGFTCEILESEATKVCVPNPTKECPEGKVWVDVLEGVKQKVQLVPDFNFSFREAWEERPPVICQGNRVAIEVDLSKIPLEGRIEGKLLSELSPSDCRFLLGRITRSPIVIREGCNQLLKSLQGFRLLAKECAGIIFCGNDKEEDRTANQHAKVIREILEELDPDLDIVIATSTEGDDGSKKLDAFANGKGDILIAKQMAGLGLDIERLKVGLDLSSIRTLAASVQRMTRVATVYDSIVWFTWITPDDCISRATWQKFIEDQGGEMGVTDLEKIEEYLSDKKEKEKESYTVDDASVNTFGDTQNNQSRGEDLPAIHELTRVFPVLLKTYSYSQIEKAVKNLNIKIKENEPIIDTEREKNRFNFQINNIAQKISYKRNGGYNKTSHGETVARVHNQIKELAGVSLEVSIDRANGTRDLEILKRLLEAAERLALKEGVDAN